MENNIFHSVFSGTGAGDSSSFDPMFSGVSLQSLLNLNPSLSAADSLTLNLGEVPHASAVEPYLFEDALASASVGPGPTDFFSTAIFDSSAFQLLPELHSMESSFPQKRRRFDSEQPHHTTLHSLAVGSPAAAFNGKAFSSSSSPAMIPQSNLARQRRHKLSDKSRCLQKLMPWDKKMDQATLLEEAYKYVIFLKAQLSALQSMPSDSPPSFFFTQNDTIATLPNGDVFGDLERLNRNQVLQVLVNSPVAQTKLYSQGFCVFSLEQLTLLNDFSSKRLLLQHMISDSASSRSFIN